MVSVGEENLVDADEGTWLIQAQNGDELAFTKLVNQYQRPVYNLCYRMLGDPYEAEDAAQETFFRAFKAIKRYDLSRSFPTWLLSIASHYCIDVIRRRRLKLIPIETLPGEVVPDTGISPEMAVRMSEQQQQVQKLLAELNPTDRSVIILYYWYDHSYAEIAQALSLTESAVKSRLHRARKALAEIWKNQQTAAEITLKRKHHESPAF